MKEWRIFSNPGKNNTNHHISVVSECTLQKSMVDDIDYKQKCGKLIKQLAQSQILNRKYQIRINHFERQITIYQTEVEQLFKVFQVTNLDEAYKRASQLINSSSQPIDSSKMVQWQNIILEYKKIINSQQEKFNKLQQQYNLAQQQYLSSSQKLKKYQSQKQSRDSIQNSNWQEKIHLQKDIQEKNAKIKLLQEEILYLKNSKTQTIEEKRQKIQFLEIENQKIKLLEEKIQHLAISQHQAVSQKNIIKNQLQKLQKTYDIYLIHFADISNKVEQQLNQLAKEMICCQQERDRHAQTIELLRQQVQLYQNRDNLSFGRITHTESQTQQSRTEADYRSHQFSIQCLKISINTLLKENNGLKNLIVLLYSKNSYEQFPEQVENELKYLLDQRLSIRQLQKQIYSDKEEETNSMGSSVRR